MWYNYSANYLGGGTILEIKKGSKGFYIGDSEDSPLAEITFIPQDDNKIIVDRTYVSDELSGRGVGKILLKELIEWARKENKKIIPQCSFVKVQMEKNEDYHDMSA